MLNAAGISGVAIDDGRRDYGTHGGEETDRRLKSHIGRSNPVLQKHYVGSR
jgi:hypothetical protein